MRKHRDYLRPPLESSLFLLVKKSKTPLDTLVILQPKLQTDLPVMNMYHVLYFEKAVLRDNDAHSKKYEIFVYKIISMEDSRRMVSEDWKVVTENISWIPWLKSNNSNWTIDGDGHPGLPLYKVGSEMFIQIMTLHYDSTCKEYYYLVSIDKGPVDKSSNLSKPDGGQDLTLDSRFRTLAAISCIPSVLSWMICSDRRRSSGQ